MAKGGRGGGGRGHGGRSHGVGHSHGIGSHGIGSHGIGHHGGFGNRGGFGHRGGFSNRSTFGRSHGFGCHRMFRNHYHGRIGGGGGGGGIAIGGMAAIFDTVATNPMPPTIDNGTYSFAGNQMSAQVNMQSFPTFYQSKIELAGGQPVPLNQASLYIVGNKTHEENGGCQMLTCMCGAFLIFPLFFMCCGWWKKIAYPQYEINPQLYRSIGNFLNCAPTVNNLTLEVVDNAFNAEKAMILRRCLEGRNMVGFTFINHATAINYNEYELDNFVAYVQPIKELPFTTNLEWDDEVA